jgi:hypothetical protein
MEEHSSAVRKAIERKAYVLYERDGFNDENDQEHWFHDDASNDCEDNRDLLRVIPFPVEVDSAKGACELNDRDLTLRLPLVVGLDVETVGGHLVIRRLALLTFSNDLKSRGYLMIRPGGLYGSTGSNPLCATAR